MAAEMSARDVLRWTEYLARRKRNGTLTDPKAIEDMLRGIYG